MTEYPLISVVILNFNTRDLLEKLIPFVLESDYSNLEVVVADNASTDGSADLVRQKFPEVRIIEMKTNHGFAEGYNQALAQLDSEFWVLLNSDVEVTKNWLNPMIDILLKDEKVAAVQPKIIDYYHRDRFEYAGAAGGFIDRWGFPFCRGRVFDSIEKDLGHYDDTRSVFWATGAAMMIRAKSYKSVGGLDGDFFAHMEEIDLCWRLHNEGMEIKVCPSATVYHMGGGTLSAQSAHKTYLNFRNGIVLLYKNLHFKDLITVFPVRLILDGIAGLKFILDGRPSFCLAILRAHVHFYKKLGKWNLKRKQNKHKRRTKHLTGWIPQSIILKFFLRKKKTFSAIVD